MAIAAVIAGLVVLTWSADRFVEGAAATARHLGMPPLSVGIVIIGFGTSAPELTVSVLSAAEGNPGLALGNAYGSNIANIALVTGLVALIGPLAVHRRVIRRELPLLGVATLASLWCLWDGTVSRLDGALLLLLLVLSLGYSLLRSGSQSSEEAVQAEEAAGQMSLQRGLVWTLIGLALLVASSRLLVWGAVYIASALGVSDLVIGLTVVAIGTSLPELASSISAVRKNQHDMVLGNMVGSNFFNTLAVVGLAGVVHPISVGSEVLIRDWPIMAALTLLLFVFCLSGRRINRPEGGVLLTIFIAYTGWLVYSVIGAASA
ncbi:calcium/sodium antiporter [Kushneria aurantia]|uniref:Calcium/sodium antiporter n=1 Tax=Kushneria aurantia TaxID=504092 RepID=A0ABV6G496_9GAMM